MPVDVAFSIEVGGMVFGLSRARANQLYKELKTALHQAKVTDEIQKNYEKSIAQAPIRKKQNLEIGRELRQELLMRIEGGEKYRDILRDLANKNNHNVDTIMGLISLARKTDERERDEKIWELVQLGLSNVKIGQRVGLHPTYLSKKIRAMIKARQKGAFSGKHGTSGAVQEKP